MARARCISIIICEHLPARKAQLFGLWFAAACFLLFSPCLLLAAVLICLLLLLVCCEEMAKKSHHFKGLQQYEDKLMDLAEGKPAFSGRGQKPSNKQVIAAIASIKKCQQGSFFTSSSSSKPCSCTCGWHLKAAARKKVRHYLLLVNNVNY